MKLRVTLRSHGTIYGVEEHWERTSGAREEERVEFGALGCEMPDKYLPSTDMERALQ